MCARRIERLLVLGCAAFAATAAPETARMAMPPEFAVSAERSPASGFGGLNRGAYRLADFGGEFTRIESRWAVFDPLFAASRAKSSFSLQGPGFDSIVAAECRMREGTVTIGILTFDPKKMTYQCSFTRAGLPMDATFVLGELKPENMRARVLARAERGGEALIDGVRVAMRSVHRYEQSRLQSPTPVGYLLSMDERTVAAIELTDVNPTVFIDSTMPLERRNAALIVALALAVLRDPENSALGDD